MYFLLAWYVRPVGDEFYFYETMFMQAPMDDRYLVLTLPDIPHHESERWLGRYGAVVSMYGPGRIRHGWWKNRVERDYYFVETRTHDVLWIYFDRADRGWYLQGIVD
jgi:protein ImuB